MIMEKWGFIPEENLPPSNRGGASGKTRLSQLPKTTRPTPIFEIYTARDKGPGKIGRTPDEEKSMASSWIDQLMEVVSSCWEWHALALRIGFQYTEPDDADDCWEVWVFPAIQEIVGGEDDGEK